SSNPDTPWFALARAAKRFPSAVEAGSASADEAGFGASMPGGRPAHPAPRSASTNAAAKSAARAATPRPPWRIAASLVRQRVESIGLVLLRLVLDFLSGPFDVLAGALDRIAGGERNRGEGQRRQQKHEFGDHGVSFRRDGAGEGSPARQGLKDQGRSAAT